MFMFKIGLLALKRNGYIIYLSLLSLWIVEVIFLSFVMMVIISSNVVSNASSPFDTSNLIFASTY